MKRKKELDALGVSAFCESMAMMIGAGIAVDDAIGLLQKDGTHGALETALCDMEKVVEQGDTLHHAMEKAEIFPDYALKMIEAGERTGRLEDVLLRLSRYYAEQKTLMGKLRNAVIYPTAMLVLVIAVMAVMLTVVLPAFTRVYDNLTGSLTVSSYSYISWAYAFCYIALGVMIVLFAALIVGLILWNSKGRGAVIWVLRKIPICANILESLAMFRFTSALSTFLSSGELQDTAVTSSIKMVDYAPVEEKLKKCVDRMEEGHSIAKAAYDEGLFEPVYGRMLLAGERSGNIESVLGRLTTLLEENCTAQIDKLIGVVDPLLSGVLMLTVAMSLLSVMLPLVGMMNAIG